MATISNDFLWEKSVLRFALCHSPGVQGCTFLHGNSSWKQCRQEKVTQTGSCFTSGVHRMSHRRATWWCWVAALLTEAPPQSFAVRAALGSGTARGNTRTRSCPSVAQQWRGKCVSVPPKTSEMVLSQRHRLNIVGKSVGRLSSIHQKKLQKSMQPSRHYGHGTFHSLLCHMCPKINRALKLLLTLHCAAKSSFLAPPASATQLASISDSCKQSLTGHYLSSLVYSCFGQACSPFKSQDSFIICWSTLWLLTSRKSHVENQLKRNNFAKERPSYAT